MERRRILRGKEKLQAQNLLISTGDGGGGGGRGNSHSKGSFPSVWYDGEVGGVGVVVSMEIALGMCVVAERMAREMVSWERGRERWGLLEVVVDVDVEVDVDGGVGQREGDILVVSSFLVWCRGSKVKLLVV